MAARSCLLGSLLLQVLVASAQTVQERQGVLLNGEANLQYDDNILNNNAATADTALLLNTRIGVANYFGKHRATAGYSGEYASYADRNDLNYDNHEVAANLLLDHSTRLSTTWAARLTDGIEDPGATNASTNLFQDFNRATHGELEAQLALGTPQSKGQLITSYQYLEQRYTNNQQAFRDYDLHNVTGTFFYRVGPQTRLLLETAQGEYDYTRQNPFSDQSSRVRLYLAGAEWDLTSKTTGIVRVGHQSRSYDADYFQDISGTYYNLDMVWRPNTYSTVRIGAGRQTTESAQLGFGGFISNSFSFGVDHEVTRLTRVNLNYRNVQDDIRAGQSRTDKRQDLSVGVQHSLRSWLDLVASYRYLSRDSTYDDFVFDSTTLTLSLMTRFR